MVLTRVSTQNRAENCNGLMYTLLGFSSSQKLRNVTVSEDVVTLLPLIGSILEVAEAP
jgi:hypothetical protein